MKFLQYMVTDPTKTAEVAQAADKALASAPPGFKMLARYACFANPAAGLPTTGLVTIQIFEAESAEAIAAVTWLMATAGGNFNTVPLLELPVETKTAELEKKYRA